MDTIGFRIANGKIKPLAVQEASIGGSFLQYEMKAQVTKEKNDVFVIGKFVPWSTDDQWVNTTGTSGKVTIGASAYLGIGGSFSSDFDVQSFLMKLANIW
ncbi:hypothetical protein [Marasmitruncus massiliensis]|uniref:hypothetical protein n=1 Tax=Marasmitruncus massiliensis TaxID=1944642 RepID=UPI000C7A440D|nr:hypothetical protein [Marasmitruncus massiliensis]